MFDAFEILKKNLSFDEEIIENYIELEKYYNSNNTYNVTADIIKQIKVKLKKKINYVLETILFIVIGTFLIALVANQVSTANFVQEIKEDKGLLWGTIYFSFLFLLIYFNEVIKILHDSYDYSKRLMYCSLYIIPLFTEIYFNYNGNEVNKLTFYSYLQSPSIFVSIFFIMIIHKTIELINLKKELLLKEKPSKIGIESIEHL